MNMITATVVQKSRRAAVDGWTQLLAKEVRSGCVHILAELVPAPNISRIARMFEILRNFRYFEVFSCKSPAKSGMTNVSIDKHRQQFEKKTLRRNSAQKRRVCFHIQLCSCHNPSGVLCRSRQELSTECLAICLKNRLRYGVCPLFMFGVSAFGGLWRLRHFSSS